MGKTITDWGSDLLPSTISVGKSRAIRLSQHLDESEYDIRLDVAQLSGGYRFTKYNIPLSNGIIVYFTNSDLEQ